MQPARIWRPVTSPGKCRVQRRKEEKSMKRNEILKAETIATWYGGSLWYGAEIKAVNDEKISLVEISGETKKAHTLKIYFNNSGAYFVLNGRRISLDECIRCY
jgi:hypothetical protein